MNMTVARVPHLRRIGLVLTIASLAAIGLATLLPEAAPATESHFCLVCGSLGGLNAVLNVLLFVPLGIGLALIGFPTKRALLAMLALSALIEAAQLGFIPGRSATIGDVLTNALGGSLGFALGRYSESLLRPSPRVARVLAVAWATTWLTIQAVSGFGFTLSLPDSRYFGQIARPLGNFAPFRGLVANANVARIQIPDTAVPDSRSVRGQLLAGATVAATVVPVGSTPDIAPIVRIADANRNEIVLLAQDGARMIFGVRTGAAVLRIRAPQFAIRDAFPERTSTGALPFDTLKLSGRYDARGVTLDAQSGATMHHRHIPIATSLGWALWLPFRWSLEGTNAEFVVSSIWIVCLVIPVGFWLPAANGSPSEGRELEKWVRGLLLGGALAFIGLFVVPHAFGLSTAPFFDWLATLFGMAVGAGIGARLRRARR